MGSLLRFLRLEPRPAGSPPEAAAVDPEIERLRAERSQRFASGMEIAEDAPDAQPFHRCAVCEADNGRFTECCTNCGASLTTPEQRAFNDALWEKIRAYQRSESPAEPPNSGTSAYGEQLARTVAQTEQARLEWMPERHPSAGARILAALPPSWRAAAVVGAIAEVAGTGVAALHTHDAGWRLAFFASVAIVGAIFVPRRR
jgi:hypothetical protein